MQIRTQTEELSLIYFIKSPTVNISACLSKLQLAKVGPFLRRAAGPARARHVSRGAAGKLPVSRHRQAALRIQCLDWIHQSD